VSDKPVTFSRTVEFAAGRVALHEDGSATFHFRGMDYVYMPGRDTDDGMQITLDKDTADAIKRLFRNEAGGY
jgi:hypothetical protein